MILGLAIVFLILFMIGAFVYFSYNKNHENKISDVEVQIAQPRNDNKALQLQNREMKLSKREQQLEDLNRESVLPL